MLLSPSAPAAGCIGATSSHLIDYFFTRPLLAGLVDGTVLMEVKVRQRNRKEVMRGPAQAQARHPEGRQFGGPLPALLHIGMVLGIASGAIDTYKQVRKYRKD